MFGSLDFHMTGEVEKAGFESILNAIGLTNPGAFAIGDTVSLGPVVTYEGIPQFSPEQFAVVRAATPTKRKQLLKGLDQLREEGAIQVMWAKGMSRVITTNTTNATAPRQIQR